jgi:enoyl-CoA hydratase/carnithine racemase
MSSPSFSTPPPSLTYATATFPTPSILFVTYTRPRQLNCMPISMHHELHALYNWFDNEPTLRCAIVTGQGRAWSAGADLKEWNQSHESAKASKSGPQERSMPPSGFAALSRRSGKKPIIAAVNGLAYGGGMEALANLDLVVAARSATVALPEVKRGVVAFAGALPRIARTIGRPRAMEMALTGRTVSAAEALSWGLVNAVTDDYPVDGEIMERPVVKKALEYAEMICANSPDSVIVSRAGVIQGWEDGSAENGTRVANEVWGKRLQEGENIKEGVRAFVEKREPRWVPSKL